MRNNAFYCHTMDMECQHDCKHCEDGLNYREYEEEPYDSGIYYDDSFLFDYEKSY